MLTETPVVTNPRIAIILGGMRLGEWDVAQKELAQLPESAVIPADALVEIVKACGGARKWRELGDWMLRYAPHLEVDARKSVMEFALGQFLVWDCLQADYWSLESHCRNALLALQSIEDGLACDTNASSEIASGEPEKIGSTGGVILSIELYRRFVNHEFPDAASLEAAAKPIHGILHDPIVHKSFKYFLLLNALNYRISASPAWNDFLFQRIVLPLIQKAAQQRDWMFLFYLEQATALGCAQQPYSEEKRESCFTPIMQAIEKNLKLETLASLPKRTRSGPLRIGFVTLQSFNFCSPDQVALKFFEGLRNLGCLSAINFYVGAGAKPAMVNKAAAVGMNAWGFAQADQLTNDTLGAKIQRLGELVVSHEIDILIYYGGFDAELTAFSRHRIAPYQVFMSMGSYDLGVLPWDGLLAPGVPGVLARKIKGKSWDCCTFVQDDPFLGNAGQAFASQAIAVRNRESLSDSIVIGAVGRPQKIDDDRFLVAVSRVLRENPSAVFVWFGREKLDSVQNRLDDLGVGGQSRFCGYVNTKIWAKVLDIHLEPFSGMSGITMFETMFAGVAPAFLRHPRDDGMYSIVPWRLDGLGGETEAMDEAKQIFSCASGETLFYVAPDVEDWVLHVNRLIRDKTYRALVGNAWRSYVKRFKSDKNQAARGLFGALERIVARTDHARSVAGRRAENPA